MNKKTFGRCFVAGWGVLLLGVGLYFFGCQRSPGISGNHSGKDPSGKDYLQSPQRELGKAETPLSLSLTVVPVPGVSGLFQLTLTAIPLAQADQMELKIILPTGVTLTQSALDWVGTIQKGDIKVLTVQVSVGKPGQYDLYGQGSLIYPKGVRLSSVEHQTLLSGVSSSSTKEAQKPAAETTSKGEKVVRLKADFAK